MTEYCPFSLHNFVEVGLRLDKKAGDWYGPYSAAQIIKSVNHCDLNLFHLMNESPQSYEYIYSFRDSVDKAIKLYPPLDGLRVYVAQDCVG